jgi:endoglucanase
VRRGDQDGGDELLWAAAELFRTTGDAAYDDYFVQHYTRWNPALRGDAPQGWPNVQNMAMYTYALSGRGRAAAVARIKSDAVAAAAQIVARVRRSGARTTRAGAIFLSRPRR